MDAGFRLVVKSPRVAGTEWSPANWTQPAPDALFYWQVTAFTGVDTILAPQPPVPQAIFGSPSAASRQALADAQRKHGDSHLLLSLVLWQSGAIEEAKAEFELLAAANPNSPVVDRLRLAIQKPSPNSTNPAQ